MRNDVEIGYDNDNALKFPSRDVYHFFAKSPLEKLYILLERQYIHGQEIPSSFQIETVVLVLADATHSILQ
jgi:hypothetical protein